MTTRWHDARSNQACSMAAEPFNVILVYEDQAGAQRGLALYPQLLSELGIACEFNLGVWKFAVLALARLDELTREQAAAADLVIICPRIAPEPPEQLAAWHQHWLELKGRDDCALIVLDEPARARPDPDGRAQGGAARAGGRAWIAQRSGTRAWRPGDGILKATAPLPAA
jgi:hypothetical protein